MQEFQTGRAAFLEELISPPRQDLYKTALSIARRELRRGTRPKSVTDTIREIQREILALKPGKLAQGFSDSSLKKLLKGTIGEKTDIKHYFLRVRQGDSVVSEEPVLRCEDVSA